MKAYLFGMTQMHVELPITMATAETNHVLMNIGFRVVHLVKLMHGN